MTLMQYNIYKIKRAQNTDDVQRGEMATSSSVKWECKIGKIYKFSEIF